ncbi:MAG TPA: GNAT family N-acetyltransferase [Bradyrhizobium sp.]|nr:GNAT family N-acetyltransferase [Bradyrhizobium sp.]
MAKISWEVCRPRPSLEPLWKDLTGRASANAFMAPGALQAAQALSFADIHMLLAWQEGGAVKRLVGWWALQERAMIPGWPKFLMAPPFRHAFVSDPVVETGLASSVIPAFFDAVERDPRLPKLIRLQYLDAESEAGHAIVDTLASSCGYSVKLAERLRPFASQDNNLKKSGSTRKKLRQDWNRLTALGNVEVLNDRAPAQALAAFEAFLALEAKSWKGAKGTALLSNQRDARFVRALVQNLSCQQDVSVALLQLNGWPIAAQVLFYSGNMAYTWKTAFDSEYAKFSPGALLVEKVTGQILALPGMDAIESCSPEGGFMEQLWDGRRSTIDLLLHVGQNKSFALDILAHRERARLRLRDARNKVRSLSAGIRAPGIAAFAAFSRFGVIRSAKM